MQKPERLASQKAGQFIISLWSLLCRYTLASSLVRQQQRCCGKCGVQSEAARIVLSILTNVNTLMYNCNIKALIRSCNNKLPTPSRPDLC